MIYLIMKLVALIIVTTHDRMIIVLWILRYVERSCCALVWGI